MPDVTKILRDIFLWQQHRHHYHACLYSMRDHSATKQKYFVIKIRERERERERERAGECVSERERECNRLYVRLVSVMHSLQLAKREREIEEERERD